MERLTEWLAGWLTCSHPPFSSLKVDQFYIKNLIMHKVIELSLDKYAQGVHLRTFDVGKAKGRLISTNASIVLVLTLCWMDIIDTYQMVWVGREGGLDPLQ